MNNNHYTHFYSLEETKRILETTKEFEDGEQIYYFIGALRYLYDEYNKQKEVLDKIKEEVLTELQSCKPRNMAMSMEINYIEEKLERLLEEIE